MRFYFLFFIYIRCIYDGNNKDKGLVLVILRPIHYSLLTQCGLVTPYGGRDLGQHWLRQWIVAWRHQSITWTNVDVSSVRLSDIHLRAISQGMPQPSNTKTCLKITYLKYHSNFTRVNELITINIVCWVVVNADIRDHVAYIAQSVTLETSQFSFIAFIWNG